MKQKGKMIISTIMGQKISPDLWMEWIRENGFDQIDFSFSPKMEEGQNIGYDLCLNSRFQQNLDSATLSELVQTRKFENDSL